MAGDTDLWKRFHKIRFWRSKEKRAPHKPLLILWAIGRCLRGEQRLVSYKQVEQELAQLIRRFGPHGQPNNTHNPFWRLANDGVWELDRPHLVGTTSSGDPLISDLKIHDIHAGLTEADYAAFRGNPEYAYRIASSIVAGHFPPSRHEEVVESLLGPSGDFGDEETEDKSDWIITRRRHRDPMFRRKVLLAYDGRCAVCEFSAWLQDQSLALEAAHIKWHEYDGPAVVKNGLALCALHHQLFDRGAFTILPDFEVKVAQDIEGAGIDNVLGQYDGKMLRAPPQDVTVQPDPEFLLWHGLQVFRNPEFLGPYSKGHIESRT